jgi:hypothetical protein
MVGAQNLEPLPFFLQMTNALLLTIEFNLIIILPQPFIHFSYPPRGIVVRGNTDEEKIKSRLREIIGKGFAQFILHLIINDHGIDFGIFGAFEIEIE